MTLSWDRVARIAAEASVGLEEADEASVARVWARLQPLVADVVTTYKAIRPLSAMLQSDLVRLGPGQEREVAELVAANAYSVIRAVTEGTVYVDELLGLTGMDTVLDNYGWELLRNFRHYALPEADWTILRDLGLSDSEAREVVASAEEPPPDAFFAVHTKPIWDEVLDTKKRMVTAASKVIAEASPEETRAWLIKAHGGVKIAAGLALMGGDAALAVGEAITAAGAVASAAGGVGAVTSGGRDLIR